MSVQLHAHKRHGMAELTSGSRKNCNGRRKKIAALRRSEAFFAHNDACFCTLRRAMPLAGQGEAAATEDLPLINASGKNPSNGETTRVPSNHYCCSSNANMPNRQPSRALPFRRWRIVANVIGSCCKRQVINDDDVVVVASARRSSQSPFRARQDVRRRRGDALVVGALCLLRPSKVPTRALPCLAPAAQPGHALPARCRRAEKE